MNGLWLALLAISTAPVFDTPPEPAGHVTIEGSSTIAPYAREVSTLLHNRYMVEVLQVGSSTGLAGMCSGQDGAPEIAAASRAIKDEELRRCAEIGIDVLIEQPIGRGGIVIAQSKKSSKISLTARDLYLATANYIPLHDDDCVLQKNQNTRWKDIRPDLPNREIIVIGPPRSSGTRDVFMSLALVEGARTFPCLAAIENSSPDYFEKATRVRIDSHWVNGGEHDEAIAQTLRYVPDAVGIFGFAYISSAEGIGAVPFEGVMPSWETIASDEYNLSRKLYLYTPKEMYQRQNSIREVLRAFGSFGAIGPGGLLTEMGLVTSGHPEPSVELDTHQPRPAAKNAPVHNFHDEGSDHEATSSQSQDHVSKSHHASTSAH